MTRADLDRTAELHDDRLGLKSKSMVIYLFGGLSEQKFLSETCRTKIFMSFFDETDQNVAFEHGHFCLLYTSPSPRDAHESRMPSSA